MAPTLASTFTIDDDPAGWLLSEKLDGVRLIWDGTAFLSRSGKTLPAPAEWIAAMPAGVVLDGELFGGRGTFQAAVGRIRRGDWDGLTFHIFDAIAEGSFPARQALLRGLTLPSFCALVEHTLCTGLAHLYAFEAPILAAGGEGVILRRTDTPYRSGRARHLLKLKREQTAEGTVTGYTKGRGRHAGQIGALVLSFAGITFQLGTGLDNALRTNPPPIGAAVTFTYFERTTAGRPRHPVFLAVRDYE